MNAASSLTPSGMLELREYESAKGVSLSLEQRDCLSDLVNDLTITPTSGSREQFDLRPGSTIGTCHLPGLDVVIRPKLPIAQVLFMLTYTLDDGKRPPEGFSYGDADDLVEAIAHAFGRALKRSLAAGLLQGYQIREEALQCVRGRLRVDEQLRTRFGRFPPVECRFDEYTEDILENKLLKAALNSLKRLPIRSEQTRRMLREHVPVLEPVSSVDFHPMQVPQVLYTRLNDRYRPAVELARLILQGRSFRLSGGRVQATSMLFDMNVVFENFLVQALRDELRLSEWEFPQNCKGRDLWLDEDQRKKLKPDFSWWRSGRCVLIGDAKYKDLNKDYADEEGGVPSADIYQGLAYCVATDLPEAFLIYAKGPPVEQVVRVRHTCKRIVLWAMKLDVGPTQMMVQIRELSARLRGKAAAAAGTAIEAQSVARS